MRKLIALLLTVSLLLGMVGVVTVASAADVNAAEAPDVNLPEPVTSVDAAGNVSVKIADAPATLTGYAYVYTKDSGESFNSTSSRVRVELTYDKAKGAYVGQEAEVAGGTMSSIWLSKSETKYNQDYTEKEYENNYYSYSYRSSGEYKGKLSNARRYQIKSKEKEIEYEYTDDEGKKQKGTTWVTLSENEDSSYRSYYSSGKTSYEYNTVTTTTGDEKKKTVSEKEVYNDYWYEGALDYTNASESSVTQSATTDGGYFHWYNADKTETSVQRNYDEEGVYNGKSESKYAYKYDKDGTQISKEGGRQAYNSKDILTSESVSSNQTTYNDKKTARTNKFITDTTSYSSKGLLTGTRNEVQTTQAKLVEEDGWSRWVPTSDESSSNSYDRNGVLSYTNASKTTYTDKGEDEYTETETETDYNTYTRAKISERVYTTKKSLLSKSSESGNYTGYKYEYADKYTKNNDDGSLRYKYEETSEYDTIDYTTKITGETHYNKDGKIVAAMDKDGTWTNASGKVIGKNYSEDGKRESTEVSFKERTGDLEGYSVNTRTDTEDGYTEVDIEYDGNGKKLAESKWVSSAKVYERYQDGVLRYQDNYEKHETKWFDSKGNMSGRSVNDPETGKVTQYNRDDKKVYEWDPTEGKNTWFDPDTGKMTSFTKENAETGRTEHYNADSKLTYSKGYEDDAEVYYDKNGKEFARTFSKYDSEKKEETSQNFYNEWENGTDSYGEWDLEDNNATLEKVVSSSETKDKTTTKTTKYTKWDVVSGAKKNEMIRTEKEVRTTTDDGYERKTSVDGVLTEHYVRENNDYDGTAKATTIYYDRYTGKQTSAEKNIYSDIPDDPMTYYKRYDKYNNLQEYAETDNTDRWNWRVGFYADGTLKNEYWYDELDSDSMYDADYYLNGQLGYEKTQNGDTSTAVRYNSNGTYRSWSETKNGVTNTWQYDTDGTFTGYRWNAQEKYDDYDGNLTYQSYEVWDTDAMLYKYEYDGETGVTTYSDNAGNKMVDGVLTLANKGNGWQYAIGSWFYIENGAPVTDAWKQLDGAWYYFGWDGKMQTGIETTDYDADGNAKNTYALSKDGVLSTGGWTDLGDGNWTYADENGEVLTGWQLIGGKWYYFSDGWNYNKTKYMADANWTLSGSRGYMATGATRIWNSDWTDKHTYFFNEDGTWDNSPGWKVVDGLYDDIEYHYYDQSGTEVTGWKQIGGDWYYFNADGVMQTGWVEDGGSWYYLDPANGGAWTSNGWANEVYEDWYYIENGQYVTGWKQIDGVWYYMKDDGAMATNQWADGYYLDASGQMATGWQQISGSWYYFDSTGAKSTGWKSIGGTWYYFFSDGKMATGEVVIDGVVNVFDASGAWQGTK